MKFKYLLIIVVVVLLISPFSSTKSQKNNNDENAIKQINYKYKIGTVQTISGELSYQGKSMIDSMKLYFDTYNEKPENNRNKIQLIVYDDSYNPSIALEMTKKLVEKDNVNAIIGGTSVGTALSVIDYVNRKKIPYIHLGGGSVELMEKAGNTVFFLQPTVTMEAMIMLEFIYNYLYASNVMIIYQGDKTGIRSRNAARAYADLKRINIIDEIKVTNKKIPYHILLNEIIKSRPDAIVMLTYMYETNEILKYLRGHSINIPAILPSFNLDYISIGMIGKENWNNTYSGRWFKSSKTKEIEEFVTIFKEKMLTYPNFFHSIGWSLCEILMEGEKRASYLGGLIYGLKSIYSWDKGISSRIDYDNSYNIGIDSMYFVGFKDNKFIEYDTFVTPDIVAYYSETSILGLLYNNNIYDDKEYSLTTEYKNSVDLICEQAELILKLEKLKEEGIEITEDNINTNNNIENDIPINNSEENINDNNIENIEENILTEQQESSMDMLTSYDEMLTNEENKEENETNNIQPEIVFNTDDLFLLLGSWKSVEIGSLLNASKFDGEIILRLKEDNRYYMDIKYSDSKKEKFNGFWEIKSEEGYDFILFDQFIPIEDEFKAYIKITNYGRTLNIIISKAKDIPSIENLNVIDNENDYKPYTIQFIRFLNK